MAKESQGIICYIATTTVNATLAANVVGEVVGWSGPALAANVIDVTHLQSTAKEKLTGVYDSGQITLNVNMLVTDSGQSKCRKALTGRIKSSLLIQLSSSATTQKINNEVFVTGLNITGSVDNKLAGDITFAITGGASFST